jgi:hypothetical protein
VALNNKFYKKFRKMLFQMHINLLRWKYIRITCVHKWFGSGYGDFHVCTEILDKKKEEKGSNKNIKKERM